MASEMIGSEYEHICDEILKIDKKIRFAAIYKQPNVHGKMQAGVESYLDPYETETSLDQALNRWKARLRFQKKIGMPQCSITKYEKIYRVTMPMPMQEDTLLCFSTEIDVDIIEIIDKVMGIDIEFPE